MKIYDPDQVIATFATVPVQGYADGTFISIEPTGEAFTTKVGADGEVVRTKTNQVVTRVRFVLMQTSDSNDVLSAIHKLDIEAPNGSGVAPFSVADKSGRFLFVAPEAWIVQAPTAEFAREAGDREWLFDCVDPQRFDGGA